MIKYSPEFYESVANRGLITAEICAGVLKGYFRPKSLLDIGAGNGGWSYTFARSFSSIETVTVIDLEIRNSTHIKNLRKLKSLKFFTPVAQDLSVEQRLPNEVFDLIICLEVLEHLPKESSELLSRKFAEKGRFLLFSAAVPGQGGTNHINEQPFVYWQNLLRQNGFFPLDVLRKKLSKNSRVPDYYKDNIVLWINLNFIHTEKASLSKLLMDSDFVLADTRTSKNKIKHLFLRLFPEKVITKIAESMSKKTSAS